MEARAYTRKPVLLDAFQASLILDFMEFMLVGQVSPHARFLPNGHTLITFYDFTDTHRMLAREIVTAIHEASTQ